MVKNENLPTEAAEAALPVYVDLEKTRRRRLGDRRDGRRIRSLPPMQYITPFIMKQRVDATNYFRASLRLDAVADYMHRKAREEGLKTVSLSHVLTAAYVRTIAQYPAMNRYISGQRIYQRRNIVMSMMVKKSMEVNGQASAIKPVFERNDSFYEVFEKMEKEIALARQQSDSTNLDNVARALFRLPTLILRGFVDLMNLLDYFGIMPGVIDRASPFHASIFLSNLGSLGIPPIYHHLYNFGNVPIFVTFGSIYKKNTLLADGTAETSRWVDYTVVTDERITDGHYYAAAMKKFDWILNHPDQLDRKPAEVQFDVD